MKKGLDKKQSFIAVCTMIAVIAVMVYAIGFAAPDYKDLSVKSDTAAANEKNTKSNDKKDTISNNKEEQTAENAPVIDAPTEYTTNRSVVLVKDRAMEMYGINTQKITEYAQIINRFAQKVPNSQVYNLVTPTSIEFYGPVNYNTGTRSQKTGIQTAYGALAGNVKPVDAYSALRMHINEYIFFRTDHHWTARGAYYAYTAFAKTAGFKPSPLDSYTVDRIDGFVGTMYKYTQSEELKNNPDYVETYKPKTNASGVIYQDAAMQNGKNFLIIAHKINSENKYLAFIQGDNPLEKITTDNKNGRKILLIKESFGNAFAPFLIDNYEEVYIIDPRNIDLNLADFVNGNGINDVLFLNYTFSMSNIQYLDNLKKIIDK